MDYLDKQRIEKVPYNVLLKHIQMLIVNDIAMLTSTGIDTSDPIPLDCQAVRIELNI